MIMNSFRSSCKVSNILVRFLWSLKFSPRIFKNKNSNIKFQKICPVEAKLFRTEGQTDTMNLTVDIFSLYERA
jgi:hypothetical protein